MEKKNGTKTIAENMYVQFCSIKIEEPKKVKEQRKVMKYVSPYLT